MELLSRDCDITSFFGTAPVMAASIRVTKRCNLNCIHCYADSSGKALKDADELTTAEIFGIIDQLADLSVNEIFFTGGEPLLRHDIADVLKYASSTGIRVLMSTNGLALTESFLQDVKNIDFKLFQISLDGPKEVHDGIRGRGSFDRAIRAVRLASACLKNVGVGTVMSRMNAHCIGETMEVAHDAGAGIFAVMFLIPSGRATKDMNPSAQQLKASLDGIFSTYRRLSPGIRLAHNTTIPPALYPPDLADAGVHTNCALCSFPYTVGIEANGDVAPCDGFFGQPGFVAGNVRKQPLKTLFESSPAFQRVRGLDSPNLTGVCRMCRYRDFCGGGCRASAYVCARRIDAPDPMCDKLYRANLFPPGSLVGGGDEQPPAG